MGEFPTKLDGVTFEKTVSFKRKIDFQKNWIYWDWHIFLLQVRDRIEMDFERKNGFRTESKHKRNDVVQSASSAGRFPFSQELQLLDLR
jgi:transcription initiation factor IIE alpha subunit